MRKFRFQFTLRTLFVVSFVIAILCSLIKCELDARNTFESVVETVEKSLKKVEQEVDEELYNSWLKEAKVNPNFSYFSEEYRALKTFVHIVLSNGGSGKGYSHDYFTGSEQDWKIKRSLLSPTTDFLQKPYRSDNDVEAVNLEIRCNRTWSILSRKTSITIVAYKAPQNYILLDKLKTALDKAGLTYEIKED